MTPHRPSPKTADPTEAFFDELARRGLEPLLQRASGTLRFDLADGKDTVHWYVTLKKGNVTVSHKRGAADAVVRVDGALFEGMATGRVNAMSATLRGVVGLEGDLGLVMSFQRLFPSPPRRRRTPATDTRGGPR
jgi:putative sterol carrier protein